MTDERSQRQVQRIDAAATTLRAIADCLLEDTQPPAALGKALEALSRELAALSREISRSSPPEDRRVTRMNGRRSAPSVGA